MALITTDEFIAKYTGKLVDVDGNGAWCVDIPKVFGVECAGVPSYNLISGNGKDWASPSGPWSTYYTQIPARAKLQKGDILSWGYPQGVINGVTYGHVGICVEDLGSSVRVFSQRQSSASAAGITITLSKNGLLGALRPKNLVTKTTNKFWYASVAALAVALGVTPAAIVAVNPGMDVSGPITPGEVNLPPTAKAEHTPQYEGGSTSGAAHAAQAVHTVNSGDTLYAIASRYGLTNASGSVDWQAIVDANRADIQARTEAAGLPIDATHPLGWWIFPGQKLTIPAN